MGVWYASAAVITGPGLGTEDATLEEVKEAIRAQFLDDSEVEQVDYGCFHIPLRPGQEEQLKKDGYLEFEVNGVQFGLEMP